MLAEPNLHVGRAFTDVARFRKVQGRACHVHFCVASVQSKGGLTCGMLLLQTAAQPQQPHRQMNQASMVASDAYTHLDRAANALKVLRHVQWQNDILLQYPFGFGQARYVAP